MSKLSEPLKAFINAAHARPNTTVAPKTIASVYEKIASDATSKQVGVPAWLSASTAATFTLNSPDSLLQLYGLATGPKYKTNGVWTAELMREIGLKCIGFNGVPRTINSLGAFHAGLPPDVQEELGKRVPRRNLNDDNIKSRVEGGNKLWESIYQPFASKLSQKLAQSHPDLPVFIIEGEYGCLFADPDSPTSSSNANAPSIGRVLTSIVAVACLRAQTGVGPQVVSHVFGLRKAFEDGTAEAEDVVPGGKWLASNEGSLWLLALVDRVVESIAGHDGTTFAPGFVKSRL